MDSSNPNQLNFNSSTFKFKNELNVSKTGFELNSNKLPFKKRPLKIIIKDNPISIKQKEKKIKHLFSPNLIKYHCHDKDFVNKTSKNSDENSISTLINKNFKQTKITDFFNKKKSSICNKVGLGIKSKYFINKIILGSEFSINEYYTDSNEDKKVCEFKNLDTQLNKNKKKFPWVNENELDDMFKKVFNTKTNENLQNFFSYDNYVEKIFSSNTNTDVSKKNENINNMLCDKNTKLELKEGSILHEKYKSLFDFEFFNNIQENLMKEILSNDDTLAVSAPTGSGKTVIMELAIIRLLNVNENNSFRVLYIAPMKTICSEIAIKWKKFENFGLTCCEFTGDSKYADFLKLASSSIIITTPEKIDSYTRNLKDYNAIFHTLSLVLIDEVHLINDQKRGHILEGFISRIKLYEIKNHIKIRYLAISATAPNIEDISEWLNTEKKKKKFFKFNENSRSVKINKIVLGYNCPESINDFIFDKKLTNELINVIKKYSDNKQTIIFCSTRKIVESTAQSLPCLYKSSEKKDNLLLLSESLKDTKLKKLVFKEIAFHHSGISFSDRKKIEEAFKKNLIKILVSTSTLSTGVNLPAHLVIIKGTFIYINGCSEQLNECQILQMIGRAGRPQFDTTANAVIMTRNNLKSRYEKLINGKFLESNIQNHISEYINTEICLKSIKNFQDAQEWLKTTFFYVRIFKNQTYYSIDKNWDSKKIQQKIEDLVTLEINNLRLNDIIILKNNIYVQTETGNLMNTYYVSLETILKFKKIYHKETLQNIFEFLCECKEICQDTVLRNSDKIILNNYNIKKQDNPLRFPITGRIKNVSQKINCLLQALFGCKVGNDAFYMSEATKHLKSAKRIMKCLLENLVIYNKGYETIKNAIFLLKTCNAEIWENSKFVSKQIPKIGITMSNLLSKSGFQSIESLRNARPEEIDICLNRHNPFGRNVIEFVKNLPIYNISIDQKNISAGFLSCELEIKISLKNDNLLKLTSHKYSSSFLIVGDEEDNLIVYEKVTDKFLIENNGCKEFSIVIQKIRQGILFIDFINEYYVGIDCSKQFIPKYNNVTYKKLLKVDSGDRLEVSNCLD